ncbi:MAG: CDP-alcohol phosphatidyltransferase family protein [Bacteroidia bacterium]
MNLKAFVPNSITCGNLLCGCLGIVFAFQGNLIWAAYMVGLAAFLDFFDGLAARLLGVSGEFGKQLDSLADMVSFGFLPGVVLFQLISISMLQHTISHLELGNLFNGDMQANNPYPVWLPFCGFLVTIFSALRLAKFNIDSRQHDSFIGLPTPANTILICSIPLFLHLPSPDVVGTPAPLSIFKLAINAVEPSSSLSGYILKPWFLITLTVLQSFLLVAPVPLFALKFKNFGWKGNELRYIFILSSLALLIIFLYLAIPIILFLYIVLSVINNLLNKSRNEIQG